MGMREDLKIPLSMLELSFLDKMCFKGSYLGKRFMFMKHIEKQKEKVVDNDGKETEIEKIVSTDLVVYVWKDLFSFENTNKEDMIIKNFEYSKSGIEEGINFVEETKV